MIEGQVAIYRNDAGFTLAEILVAIAIFGVVISLTYGTYNLTFKTINSARSHTQYGERARVVLDRFIEDLESFHKGTTGYLTGELVNFGEARGDSLSFSSRAHVILNRKEEPVGFSLISYRVEEDEKTGFLILYRSDIPYRPGVSDGDSKGFLLCDNLRDVRFTYLDEDGDESDSWDNSGNTQSKLPLVVKMRLGFGSSEGSEDSSEGVIYYSASVAIPPVE